VLFFSILWITIGGANGHGSVKIKLSELESGVRTFKDTAPYGTVDGSPVYSTSSQDDALLGNGLDAAEEFDERLACPICQLPAFCAVMTKKCGHHFHQSCLNKALQSKKQCPVCRTPVKAKEYAELKQIKESRFLHQSINDVKVLCTMGCGKKVKFEMLRDHVRNECTHTMLLCKHGSCLHHDNRSRIGAHEQSCGEAMMQCIACGESIKRKAEADHLRLDCRMKPIQCEYCHKQGIARNDFEAHLDSCNGAVPMSMVRKLLTRLGDVEARLEELEGKGKRRKTS
jgi:hypothetical protein